MLLISCAPGSSLCVAIKMQTTELLERGAKPLRAQPFRLSGVQSPLGGGASVESLLSASRDQREEEEEEWWGRGDRIFSSRGPTLAHMCPIVVETFCSSRCLL
jgi:hypothetical protein